MRSRKFTQTPSRILGIDPGFGRLGLAVIEKHGSNQKLIYSECFETDAKIEHPKRLLLLGGKVSETIKKYHPDEIAIETLLFSKNQKTALQVAEARGVLLSEAARNKISVREFNPNQVKLAVTGYGKSDKKQIISMVERLLKIEKKKRHDDEFDAIAIALTCSAMPIIVSDLSTDRFE
jgi:crossover junction endodeoxyribonuclease RuvC